MGVSALNRVIIITFFTLGLIVGLTWGAIQNAASAMLRPEAGSAEAVLEALDIGNSRVYNVR